MSDLPLDLPSDRAATLRAALDQERKLDRALEALGPIAERDVVVVGGGEDEVARYRAAGARVTAVDGVPPWPVPDGSADAIVSVWSAFRGPDPAELTEAERVLRPDGRLLVVHDYGRDDVSRLRGELPEHGDWSRRDGPFLGRGFRIRVIHAFWTFASIEAAQAFLSDAFGERGREVGAGLKRARLSYNVAVYHRSRGGSSTDAADVATAAG